LIPGHQGRRVDLDDELISDRGSADQAGGTLAMPKQG